jgi:hypothetical protein
LTASPTLRKIVFEPIHAPNLPSGGLEKFRAASHGKGRNHHLLPVTLGKTNNTYVEICELGSGLDFVRSASDFVMLEPDFTRSGLDFVTLNLENGF